MEKYHCYHQSYKKTRMAIYANIKIDFRTRITTKNKADNAIIIK